eukprot:364262-Chlamydomonas_euryale.AAC.13
MHALEVSKTTHPVRKLNMHNAALFQQDGTNKAMQYIHASVLKHRPPPANFHVLETHQAGSYSKNGSDEQMACVCQPGCRTMYHDVYAIVPSHQLHKAQYA